MELGEYVHLRYKGLRLELKLDEAGHHVRPRTGWFATLTLQDTLSMELLNVQNYQRRQETRPPSSR
jgi:hypothetical protein